MMYRRLRGYRCWVDKDGKMQAVSPLLDKPVYRPGLLLLILALLAWAALIGLVTWAVW
jgi:hypothetical protein